MTTSGDRQYTTYLALSGAPSADAHFTPTHVRVSIWHVADRKQYILSITAVAQHADGKGETSMLVGPPRSYYGTLQLVPRYSAKELAAWARVVDAAIQEEKSSIWERIGAVVQAHGASIAK